MAKEKKVTETYCETYNKNSNPIDLPALIYFLKEGKCKGFVQRQGALSDGKSFSQVYLIIDQD